MHLERGKLDDILLGYFEHWLTLYALGDKIYSVMTEDELEHLAYLNHFMFNAKKITKTARRMDWKKVHLDQEARESFSDKQILSAYVAWNRPGALDIPGVITDAMVSAAYITTKAIVDTEEYE